MGPIDKGLRLGVFEQAKPQTHFGTVSILGTTRLMQRRGHDAIEFLSLDLSATHLN